MRVDTHLDRRRWERWRHSERWRPRGSDQRRQRQRWPRLRDRSLDGRVGRAGGLSAHSL